MTRKITIALLIALAFAVTLAFPQCSDLSISPTLGIEIQDSGYCDTTYPPTVCDTCNSQGSASWDISGRLNGIIRVWSRDSLPAQVWITTQCSLVVYGSCGRIGPDSSDGIVFQISDTLLNVNVCGQQNTKVIVSVFEVSAQMPTVVSFYNLNGCIVSVIDPLPRQKRYAVFDGYLWRISDKPPASGWYKELR